MNVDDKPRRVADEEEEDDHEQDDRLLGFVGLPLGRRERLCPCRASPTVRARLLKLLRGPVDQLRINTLKLFCRTLQYHNC